MYIQFIIKTEEDSILKTDILDVDYFIQECYAFPYFYDDENKEEIIFSRYSSNYLSINRQQMSHYPFLTKDFRNKKISIYQSEYSKIDDIQKFKQNTFNFISKHDAKKRIIKFKESKYISYSNLLNFYMKNKNYDIEKMKEDYLKDFYGLNYTGISFILYNDNKKKLKTYQITQERGVLESSDFYKYQKTNNKSIEETNIIEGLLNVNNIEYIKIRGTNYNPSNDKYWELAYKIKEIVRQYMRDDNNRFYFIEETEKSKNNISNKIITKPNIKKIYR